MAELPRVTDMRVAALISTVFTPELFVLVATLLLTGYDLRRTGWRWQRFAVRIAVVSGAWLVAVAVYQGGPTLVAGSVPGGADFFASVALIVSFATIGVVWRRRAWGHLLPTYCLLLIATSVIHIVVVPVWDLSSHVLYAAVPTAYLATIDRRFVVLFFVPLGLVWSRVALDAHTFGETLGGLAVAAVIVTVAIRRGLITDERTVPLQ